MRKHGQTRITVKHLGASDILPRVARHTARYCKYRYDNKSYGKYRTAVEL